MKSVNKNSNFMPHISELNEQSSSILIDKGQFILMEQQKIVTLPSTYLQNIKMLSANCSLDKNQKTLSYLTQLPDNVAQTFLEKYPAPVTTLHLHKKYSIIFP